MKPIILYSAIQATQILGIAKRSVLERAVKCGYEPSCGIAFFFDKKQILQMAPERLGKTESLKRGRPKLGRTRAEVKAWFEEHEE
jgi:hypothetical protein